MVEPIPNRLNPKDFVGTDPQAARRRIEAIEHLLERALPLPGTDRRIGADALLSLLPVGGSLIGAAMGSWLAWEARNLGLPKHVIARMAGNIGVDAVLGAIPFVGAIPDFFFRSNTRNLRLIKKHLDKRYPGTATIDA